MSQCLTRSCPGTARYGVNLPQLDTPIGGEIVHSCWRVGCLLRLATLHAAYRMRYAAHKGVAGRKRSWMAYCATAPESAMVTMWESLPSEAREKAAKWHGIVERDIEVVREMAQEIRRVA